MSNENDLTEIKVSTARIEEQVKSLVTTTSLQHKIMSEQIEKLAGKAEVQDIEARVEKLESAQSWVVRGIVMTAMTALAAAAGIGKKLGL